MGGLSNIIDGIYNDDSEEQETISDSTEVSSDEELATSSPSLQQLADEMSSGNQIIEETPDDGVSEEAEFLTQDDVFETPAYENISQLPEAPTPPEAVSSQMIERLKAVALEPDDEDASEPSSEFTIAPPPEGLTSEDFETVDSSKNNNEDDDYDIDSTRSLKATLGNIASDSSHEPTEELAVEEDPLEEIRTHSAGSFIWTRDADDILPGRKNR